MAHLVINADRTEDPATENAPEEEKKEPVNATASSSQPERPVGAPVNSGGLDLEGKHSKENLRKLIEALTVMLKIAFNS